MWIGELIKQARKTAGLTQTELGEKIGTSGVTIMRYEKGQRQPRIEQIQKIADALGITMRQLMELDDDQEYIHKEMRWTMTKEDIERQTEAALQSMADNPYQLIFAALNELNTAGQQKAVERVEELTEIPKYQREESN